MKTDVELFKEYFDVLEDEREVLEWKITLFDEMNSSDGVFKGFGSNAEELRESLFNIKMLQTLYRLLWDGRNSEELERMMGTEDFKKYAEKKWSVE